MAGDASEVEIAGVLIALRTKGETVDELAGLARDDARACHAGHGRPRRPARHGRHRRRAADVQRLDDRGADRRRRRLRGRQARQPLGHRACPARPTCSRRSARASTSRPRRVARCIERGRLRLHVRARPPRRDALRRPGAQGARGAHDLQLPRPADQPGRRDAPAHRRLRPGVPRRRWRARSRGWAPTRAGSVQRGWTRRAEHLRRRRGSSRSTAASCERYEVAPGGRRAASAPAYEDVAGGTPDGERARRRARSSPASPARRATSRCSTPAPRSTPAGRADGSSAGVRAAEAAIDSGAAAAGARPARARSRRSWRRMNVLDRIVDATREEVERRRESVPLASSSARSRDRPESRPFPEALTRPGISVIAEHKRRSPSAGEIREGATVDRGRPGLRARRRGGAVGAHRAAPLRRLARRPARGARGDARCRSCARTSSSTRYQVYESAAAGADAILLIVAALEPDDLRRAAPRGARARPRRARRGPRRGGARDARSSRRRRRDRHQQPRPDDFSVDVERTYELLVRRPGGQDRRLGVRLLTREQLDELERVGVDAVLVGETLMRAPDLEAACRELTGGGDEPAL